MYIFIQAAGSNNSNRQITSISKTRVAHANLWTDGRAVSHMKKQPIHAPRKERKEKIASRQVRRDLKEAKLGRTMSPAPRLIIKCATRAGTRSSGCDRTITGHLRLSIHRMERQGGCGQATSNSRVARQLPGVRARAAPEEGKSGRKSAVRDATRSQDVIPRDEL